MMEHKKQIDDAPDEKTVLDRIPTDQHPDWHPFAVWKSQIRSEQVGTTGQYRTLSSAKVADA